MHSGSWIAALLLIAGGCAEPARVRHVGEESTPSASLVPMPRRMLDECLRVEELRDVCPTKAPRVDRSGYRDSYSSDQRDVWSFGAQWGAPYEGLTPKNAPPRFAHLHLLGGDLSHYVSYEIEPKGRGKIAEVRDHGIGFGERTWNGRRGELSLAPPYATGGGVNGDHLMFRWTEAGRDYALSLHAWDRLHETEATLKAIVESLPPGEAAT